MRRIIGLSGLILTSAFIYFFSSTFTFITKFSVNLAPNNYLEPHKILIIKVLFIIFIITLLAFSLISILNIKLNVNKKLDQFIDTKAITKFFFEDNLCTKKKLPIYIFFLTTISSIFLHLSHLTLGKPTHEGILENYTTPLFLFAGIVLLISSFLVTKRKTLINKPKLLRLSLITFSIMLLYIFGEEISWGQNFFGWESFGAFENLNFQRETNLHNFFNPLFRFVYPTVGIGAFLIVFLFWFFPKQSNSFFLQLLIPHPCFFYILLILAASSFEGQSETFEALLAISVFLYSIRVFMCLKFPSNN